MIWCDSASTSDQLSGSRVSSAGAFNAFRIASIPALPCSSRLNPPLSPWDHCFRLLESELQADLAEMRSSLFVTEGAGDLGERKAAIHHGPQAGCLDRAQEVHLVAPAADDRTPAPASSNTSRRRHLRHTISRANSAGRALCVRLDRPDSRDCIGR